MNTGECATLDDGLMLELTIHSTEWRVIYQAANDWLRRGLSMAAGGISPAQYERETPFRVRGHGNVPKGLAGGRPGNRWGLVTLSHPDSFDISYNPYRRESLEWISHNLENRPESIGIDFGIFQSDGSNGDRIVGLSVAFDEDLVEFVRLRFHVGMSNSMEEKFKGGYPQALALNVVRQFARDYSVVFGHVSFEDPDGLTEFEKCLPPAKADPVENIPLWPRLLRGYSWITIISDAIATRLGLGESITESGAFESVERLPNGALWMQATQRYADYRGGAVRSVWEVFNDVLIPGDPRRPRSVPGQAPSHMVVFE